MDGFYRCNISFKIIIGLSLSLCVLCGTRKAKAQESGRHHFYRIYRVADPLLPSDDPSEGTTQSEMNTSDYPRKMDSVLNYMYNSILRDYKKDTAFINALKNAQRAWLKFRDAELLSIMPPSPPGERGSIEPLCSWEYKVAITRRRIEELNMWYHGTEEETGGGFEYVADNLCGSYKTSAEMKILHEKKKK